MSKKGIALCLTAFLICIAIAVWAQEKSLNRVVSEKLIAQIDLSSRIPESFKVSLDNKRIAYVVQVLDKEAEVTYREGIPYTLAEILTFHTDNKQVLWVGDKMFVVVDGKDGKQYDYIGEDTLIVSPDSKQTAYVARLGNKGLVVVNGKDGKQYDGILENSFIFSPNGEQVAYGVGVGDKRSVVLGQKEKKEYDGVGGIIFSPDSKQVAYGARVSDKFFVAVNGEEGKQYDGVRSIIFSPDSKQLAYAAALGNKRFVVVDGEEGKQYDAIATKGGGRIIFDSPDSFHYLAGKGNEIYLVEETIK